MVRELVIKPKADGTYIPFVHARLLKPLRYLRLLAYDLSNSEQWIYPPRYHSLVARDITQLAIHYPAIRSPTTAMWLETFRLVWSLPKLSVLFLDLTRYPDITESGMRHLRAIRRPGACAELKTLVLKGEFCCNLLPECAFGTSVKQLSLLFHGDRLGPLGSNYGPLLAQINHFSSLQELHIYISRSGRPGKDTSAASGYIVPVLAHLRPDALQTVSFRLGNLGSGRRGHFFLELRSKVDELLTKFPRLGSVSFQLPCPVGDLPRDVGMLERLLLDRLPKLRETGVPVTLQWHHP
ncbi:hypothetical protein OH76DRAFT_907690 [Lentinus brumalis]|uniref:F-box domain-containing protein n=1 Tax=Lentinus brumalis TaxID=2498619 RepID=A0A371D0I3_9APHY|nr:hypothetical protein OH76DRAFT_907690 [Polyporus brumalis]